MTQADIKSLTGVFRELIHKLADNERIQVTMRIKRLMVPKPADGIAKRRRLRLDPDDTEDFDKAFSVRVAICLNNRGICSLPDLRQHSASHVTSTRNFGLKSFRELIMVLRQRNWRWTAFDDELARAAFENNDYSVVRNRIMEIEQKHQTA